jgi:hypothetical protein
VSIGALDRLDQVRGIIAREIITYVSNKTTSILWSLCRLLCSILAGFQKRNLGTSGSHALDLGRGHLAKVLIRRRSVEGLADCFLELLLISIEFRGFLTPSDGERLKRRFSAYDGHAGQ